MFSDPGELGRYLHPVHLVVIMFESFDHKHYADAEGHYLGEFRSVRRVNEEGKEVVFRPAVPEGAFEVPSAPPDFAHIWNGSAWVVDPGAPAPKQLVDFATCLERLTQEEWAKVDQIESSSPRFKMWIRRALAQGSLNVNSPEFAQAKQAVVGLGVFTAKRFVEIFAP